MFPSGELCIKIIFMPSYFKKSNLQSTSFTTSYKFVSRIFNRLVILPLTLPLCLVLVLGVGNVWGQAFTGTYSFASATGNVASLNYNGTAISNLTVSALVKNGVTTTSSSGNSRATGWDTGSTNGEAIVGGSVNTGKYYEFTQDEYDSYGGTRKKSKKQKTKRNKLKNQNKSNKSKK